MINNIKAELERRTGLPANVVDQVVASLGEIVSEQFPQYAGIIGPMLGIPVTQHGASGTTGATGTTGTAGATGTSGSAGTAGAASGQGFPDLGALGGLFGGQSQGQGQGEQGTPGTQGSNPSTNL